MVNPSVLESVGALEKGVIIPTCDIAKELKKIVRDYTKTILSEKYRVVDYGEYADTKEQQEEKSNLFLSKVKFLEEALDNIVKDTKIEEEETVD